MTVKVMYEKGILKLLEPLEGFKEGERLEVEIRPDIHYWRGTLKDLKLNSTDLQHKIKEIWSDRYVSH